MTRGQTGRLMATKLPGAAEVARHRDRRSRQAEARARHFSEVVTIAEEALKICEAEVSGESYDRTQELAADLASVRVLVA